VKIENRQQTLVILAAVAVGLFLADQVVFGPLMGAWKDRAARITDLRKQVSDGKKKLEREKAIVSRAEFMRTNMLSADESVAVEQMFKAIYRWGDESHVSITSIKPSMKHTTEDFLAFECHVDASGSISTLSKFLYNLEKDPIAVRVESVELSARDTAGRDIALGLQVSGLVTQSQTEDK
jgi:hypothetical protein